MIESKPSVFNAYKTQVARVFRHPAYRNQGVAMHGPSEIPTDMGPFIGQPPAFFAMMQQLAADADAAHRGQG